MDKIMVAESMNQKDNFLINHCEQNTTL